jgi:hypothetical protein
VTKDIVFHFLPNFAQELARRAGVSLTKGIGDLYALGADARDTASNS